MCESYSLGKAEEEIEREHCILASNIKEDTDRAVYINYSSYVDEDSILADNSVMMLLRLLQCCGVRDVALAGFDGMKDREENYAANGFVNSGHGLSAAENNRIITEMFQSYRKQVGTAVNISFLTPSIYVEGESV